MPLSTHPIRVLILRVLDVFSTIDADATRDDVRKLLRKSWAENPDKTLYSNHRKTAISNHPLFVSQVIERQAEKELKPPVLSQEYSKDLLNILLLVYSNQFTSPSAPFTAAKAERWKEEGGKDAYTKETAEKVARTQGDASKSAKQASDDHTQLSTKLKIDPPFKAPHVAVARIFASSREKNAKILRDISKTESKEERQRLRRTNVATAGALDMYVDGAFGLSSKWSIDEPQYGRRTPQRRSSLPASPPPPYANFTSALRLETDFRPDVEHHGHPNSGFLAAQLVLRSSKCAGRSQEAPGPSRTLGVGNFNELRRRFIALH
ncbi:hypothetical protein FRB90_011181 [Tulasnella sp. 427]|nr:hypothetical protein FRB90_011181 [Tulasnella sp. 427]